MQFGNRLRKGLRLLGSMLIGERLATEEQVRAALEEQQRRKRRGSPHKRLGEILVEMSVVEHSDLDRLVAEQEDARKTVVQDIDRVLAERKRAQAEAAQKQAEAAHKQEEAAQKQAEAAQKQAEAPFVASSHGSVFHKRNCKSVQRINPANLQAYSSREEAESAGKRPCTKCC
jgi:hypothetical protein